MNEWFECRIDDLGEINRGKSKHRPRNDAVLFGGKYPFIQTADVKKAHLYITEYDTTYSDIGLAQSKLWKKGTLCITIAANIAESAILGIEACFPDSVVGFTPFKNKGDLKFVKYMLDEFKVYMQQISKGTTQDNLSLEKLRRVKFRAPSYDTQVRIAGILSTYDDLIESNNKRIKILEQMAENLYKEWFVRFRFPGHETTPLENGIPKGWKYVCFSEIFDYTRGVSYSSEEIECEEGENLVNLKNIQGFGGFRRDGTKKFNGKYKLNQMVKEHDLIMGVTDMTQDRRTVGAVALVPKIDGVISADLIKICSSISNIFSYCMFRWGAYSAYISQFGNGANVIHLKPASIKNIKILKPSDVIIEMFVKIAEPIIENINRLNVQNDKLIKQRDLLLPRLMSGKLAV
jgi:type I restriction enzyme S subunit